jgi:hypothetical protein
MVSDMVQNFRDMKEASKAQRASNRLNGAEYLKGLNIPYTEHNNGAHLIIEDDGLPWIDYWPGTGTWAVRNGRKGQGISQLIAYIKGKV